MATVTSLIQQTRRFIRDYPELDASTASIASGGTTLTVADSSIYAKNWTIQLDTEAMNITALPSGTTLTVRRGVQGTTAVSHASGTVILIKPAFLDLEYLDALNYAQDQMYPYVYREVDDTSLTTSANTFEYTIPTDSVTSKPIRHISRVQLKQTGAYDYKTVRGWNVIRGTTPAIQFKYEPNSSATIRIRGFGYFADLTASGSTDTKFPEECLPTLVLGAAEYLTASGEAGRARVDTGVIDSREQANRVGSSLNLSNSLFQRFERSLQKHAMPPLPVNVQPVF